MLQRLGASLRKRLSKRAKEEAGVDALEALVEEGTIQALHGTSDLPTGCRREVEELLARYLAAEKGNVAAAAARLQQQAAWRRGFGVPAAEEVPNEIAAGKVLLQPPPPPADGAANGSSGQRGQQGQQQGQQAEHDGQQHEQQGQQAEHDRQQHGQQGHQGQQAEHDGQQIEQQVQDQQAQPPDLQAAQQQAAGPRQPLVIVVVRNHLPGDGVEELERFVVWILDTASLYASRPPAPAEANGCLAADGSGHAVATSMSAASSPASPAAPPPAAAASSTAATPASSAAAPPARSAPGQLAVLFHLRAISLANLHLAAVRVIFHTMKRHFPERIGSITLLDAGWVFHGAWHLIEPFIDASSRKKVRFLSGPDGRAKLVQELGADVVPAEFGGRADSVPIELAAQRLPAWQRAWAQQQQQQHCSDQDEKQQEQQQEQVAKRQPSESGCLAHGTARPGERPGGTAGVDRRAAAACQSTMPAPADA